MFRTRLKDKVIFKNGLITDINGKMLLTVDVLKQLDTFRSNGKEPRRGLPLFETKTLEPSLLIEPYRKNGTPKIRLLLGAKKGGAMFPLLQSNGTPADYLIDSGIWYPLPRGTITAFDILCKKCGVKDTENITVGSYLKLISNNTLFTLEDRTNQQFSSAKLQSLLDHNVDTHLCATPYEYQKVGIAWINFMASQNVGCILADEMGLGKTLQIIGYLVARIGNKQKQNLIICPATLIENWRREIARFAPNISVYTHSGARRRGIANALIQKDICISSYDTVLSDISIFEEVTWDSVILDEAQNIKNPFAKRTMAIKGITKRIGIAVTGTPIENKIGDAWSIADFVFPSYLGKVSQFESEFSNTIEGAFRFKPFLSVLMLRRRVSEVANDLPPRIDIPVPLELDRSSKSAYEKIRTLKGATATPEILTYLRMFCAHPWLQNEFTDIPPLLCSQKLQRCLEICEEIRASSSKVIIFTSFTESINILNKTLSKAFNMNIETISGKTEISERQRIVDTFNQTEGFAVLILNPRAGGVGLNITGANHVIHYNLEWNPSVEDQASARAYRRGQKSKVTVHKLFYINTVEEVIKNRMETKRCISEAAAGKSDKDNVEVSHLLQALRVSPITGKDDNN